MEADKTGRLIRQLRRGRGMTQRDLAARLRVSDKAVSKWERGAGCPDISILTALSRELGVDTAVLLTGDLSPNAQDGGNMKKLRFYVCPDCGNTLTATAQAVIACCGKSLPPLTAQKAAEDERLTVALVDGDNYVTSAHPMTKEHHITFVAFLTGDSVFLRKQYPEWDMQARFPVVGHGTLVWHCTRHGLFCQLL